MIYSIQEVNMKTIILALTACLSFSALATDNVPVPPGFYSGTGTWTDNMGGSGTWATSTNIYVDNSGLHNEFSAQFSDGRQYQGSVLVQFQDNSTYNLIANIGGQSVTVGSGVSTPAAYENSNLMLNAQESIDEIGHFTSGVWYRSGAIKNHTTGRVTLLTMRALPAQKPH
jgi:hypothetical protein